MESKRILAEDHNEVALLDESLVPEGFTDMVKFINATNLRYALTVNPTIIYSYIKQFWHNANVKSKNGETYIESKVDGQKVLVTESSIREVLLFDDETETKCLPNLNIFTGLADLGYEGKHTNLKFQKGLFSPQWKYLLHTLLHCLSPKTSGWNEFGTVMASAMICLCKGNPFNFSNMILEGMVKSIKDKGTFLLYPRFVHLLVVNQIEPKKSHKHTFEATKMVPKMFTFLKKINKGFSGKVTPLLPYMVELAQKAQGEGSGTHTDSQHTPTLDTSSPAIEKNQTPRETSKNTELPQTSVRMKIVADEAVIGGGGDMMVRAATTASSLDAEQDSGNIPKTQSMATSNVEGSLEPNTGDGNPSQMENIGGSGDQTWFDPGFMSQDSPLGPGHTGRSDEDRHERNELMDDTFVPIVNSSDPPLGPVNTGRSGEDIMKKVNELTDTCTNLANRCTTLESQVVALQTLTTSQAKLIKNLMLQFKGVGANSAANLGEDASKQGRNETVDSGEEVELDTSAGVDNVAEKVNVMASGEAVNQVDMDVDSGDNEFVVVDQEDNAVVMEEASKQSVVETLKTLEPEQLIEGGIQTLDSAAVDQSHGVDNSTASTKGVAEAAATNVQSISVAGTKVAEHSTVDSTAIDSDPAASQNTLESGEQTSIEQLLMLRDVQSIVVQPKIQSQEVHVAKLPTKGVTIKEPILCKKSVNTVSPSAGKGKGKMVEDEEYKNLPKEFWPNDKLLEYDMGVAMELAMEGLERTGDDQDQLDWNKEQARIIQQQEAIAALNSRRNNKSEPKNAEVDYEPTSDEIEYMIKNNPEVSKKALEFCANQSLNPEQKTAQLCDFIRMITDQASDYLTDEIKKKQKRKRKATEAQMIAEMKQYLCKQAGWKMHQFKGMPYDEVRLHYFTAYKRNSVFCARGSKEEAEWIKKMKNI